MHSENTAKIITNYFFFSFHPNVATNLQEFYQIDNTCTTQVRRVNILNVYFKLKDPFIHCSFTQRNSHLFYNKYSSITNLHNKIYPNTKFYRHLLERLQQRFFLKRKMARGNISNSSRWKLIQIKKQVILSPESPGILFRYTGNGFINYTAITLSMNQIFIILAFLSDKSESRISYVFRLVSY